MSDLDTPIYGVTPIAAALGLTKSKTYYALSQGHIPATKLGKIWVTTPRRIRDWLNSDAKSEAVA